MVTDLAAFRAHVKKHSPAFIPMFTDESRYQVIWGGAGSGKSHMVARKILYRMLKERDYKHNFLIIRKVDRTIKRSVFTLMCNIISTWGLREEFNYNLTDKTITYKQTGSQIMFSGLDDVEKLKSIEGVTSIWCEEATELNQEDFEQLDLRLRGESKYIKQITLTLNPISEQHWIKRVFFDDPIDGVFTLKTTFLDNSFIDDEYKMVMENKTPLTRQVAREIQAAMTLRNVQGFVFGAKGPDVSSSSSSNVGTPAPSNVPITQSSRMFYPNGNFGGQGQTVYKQGSSYFLDSKGTNPVPNIRFVK